MSNVLRPPYAGHFGFVYEENLVREITCMIGVTPTFSKTALFSRVFSSAWKPIGKSTVFKFLRFEERFRKLPVSLRIIVDGRSNHRNKATFSIFLEKCGYCMLK